MQLHITYCESFGISKDQILATPEKQGTAFYILPQICGSPC